MERTGAGINPRPTYNDNTKERLVMGKKVVLDDFVRYRSIKRECERLAQRIKALKQRQGERVVDKVRGSLTSFPYTQVDIKIVGTINNKQRIREMERRLAAGRAEARILLARLVEFLRTIPTEYDEIRDTLEFYYIEGLRYGDIPEALGLEGDGSVQMRAARKYCGKVAETVENKMV